jgi:MFS family permease
MPINNHGVTGHPATIYQTRQKVKKSLRLAVLDGGAYAAMMGLTQNYITPFALTLHATAVQIGLLTSAPGFTIAFSQLAAPGLVDRAGNRKRLILPAVFVHALTWLPVFLLPYFFQSSGVWWLIGLITVSSVADALANPPWGSMMADLVHEDLRGRYFSFRGRIAGVIALVTSFIAGAVLQLTTGNTYVGFAIIFGGALFSRLVSLYFLARMYEPPIARERDDAPSVLQIVKHLGASNLGRFTLYVSLMYFGMMIAGPFFTVFMLRDLHFSYVTFTIINTASAISTLVFLPFWGRRADRAGNVKIVRITTCLMPFIPLLWLVSANPGFLMAVNVFSGFVWAGFSLATTNFVYDASESGSRTKHIAVFNSIAWLALAVGALVGGYLVPRLPELLGYEIRSLFVISGVVRGLVVILLLRTIVEVRRVPASSFLGVLRNRQKTTKKSS